MLTLQMQNPKNQTPSEEKKPHLQEEYQEENREIPEWMIFACFLIVGLLTLIALFYHG